MPYSVRRIWEVYAWSPTRLPSGSAAADADAGNSAAVPEARQRAATRDPNLLMFRAF